MRHLSSSPWRRRSAVAAVTAAATIALWPRHDAPRPRPTHPQRPPVSVAVERHASARVRTAPLSPTPSLVQVSGTVTDRRTHQPVPAVEVVFTDGDAESTTVADAAGRYQLALVPGRYRPFVQGAGVLSTAPRAFERLPERPGPAQIAVPVLERTPALELRAATDGVDLEVDRAATIRGRVVDRGGLPIAGAIVRATITDDPGAPRPVLGTDVAETDDAGRFALEVAATRYRLDAFHDDRGGARASTELAVAPGETAETELVMQAGCVISGRVVRADGQPAAEGALERNGGDTEATGSYQPAGAIAADGTFVWSTLDEETLFLRAWPWGSPPSPARRFVCSDGARYPGVVFQLPDDAPDLSGRVVTADGRPVPFAFIDVAGEDDGAMTQQERADADGHWQVHALPPGPYQITTSADGAGVAVIHARAPAHDLELRLSGTVALVGRITGLTDGPVTLTVRACGLGDDDVAPQLSRLVSVVDGHYRVDGVPACHLGLQLDHHDRSLLVEAPPPTGPTLTLDLDFTLALTPDQSDALASAP